RGMGRGRGGGPLPHGADQPARDHHIGSGMQAVALVQRQDGGVPDDGEGGGHHFSFAGRTRRRRVRGSRLSRRDSPSRVKAMTRMVIASPGMAAICGALKMKLRPSLVMMPHSAVGGWTPRPRNDSPAAVITTAPMMVQE